MFTTSPFGCGIDVGNVRCVLHAGRSYTMMESVPDSGRVGIDGLPPDSIISLLNAPQRWSQEYMKSEERILPTCPAQLLRMPAWPATEDQSWRLAIELYIDDTDCPKHICVQRMLELCHVL